MNNLYQIIILLMISHIGIAQCDLIIKYDAAGNRIFRGNECDPECSTLVSNTDDIGVGTLRNAIFCASDGDYITFESALDNESIDLEAGKIIIDKSIQINQSDQMYAPINIEVQSLFDDVVFEVLENNTVIIEQVDLTSNPGFDANARVLKNNGTLTLQNLTLTDDAAFKGTNNTLLNTGSLNILQLVKLIYVSYQ